MTATELKAMRTAIRPRLTQAALGMAAGGATTERGAGAMVAAYESGARKVPRWRVKPLLDALKKAGADVGRKKEL